MPVKRHFNSRDTNNFAATVLAMVAVSSRIRPLTYAANCSWNHPITESLWLLIRLGQRKFLLCFCYLPPKHDYDAFDLLADEAESLIAAHPTAALIMAGDLNMHNTAWLNHSLPTNQAGKAGFQFAATFNLSQLVTEPTFIRPRPDGSSTKSTLDVFLTNCPEVFKFTGCSPRIGHSDHEAVHVSCSIPTTVPVQPPK